MNYKKQKLIEKIKNGTIAFSKENLKNKTLRIGECEKYLCNEENDKIISVKK